MTSLRAKVLNGRIVVDEPTTLPEGTELNLVVDDEGDDLDDQDRRDLHAALSRALQSIKEGKGRPASEVIAELRKRG